MDRRYILDGCVEIGPEVKKNCTEIRPNFIAERSTELMIRGGDFYAVWLEDRGLWSTDELDAVRLIDREVRKYAYEYRKENPTEKVVALEMRYVRTRLINEWHNYCKRDMRDNYHALDEKLIFSNHETTKSDYASKKLDYPLQKGDCPAYEKLMSTLYSEEERHKLEWAIGAVVSGDSKKIQKFIVLYGAGGTGKSTVIGIIEQLFKGYCCTFDAKALGNGKNNFALEPFKSNPLVAIQHDGDLSKIEDNTRLNSLVSHESMVMEEKFKSAYENQFSAFLFMATNRPVKITDAKSGLIRRLIDVSPTGNLIPKKEYDRLKAQVSFELGAIAYHCLQVYLRDPHYYDDYVPKSMMSASNDFYNFVADSYFIFKENNGTTLKAAWNLYCQYCDEAKVPYPMPKRVFTEELKNYFESYNDRLSLDDGSRVRSYYSGFKADIFLQEECKQEKPTEEYLIAFEEQPSIFDEIAKDWLAQYASEEETPTQKWANVKTTLADLDTSRLHYVKVPKNHIVIDFDIPDENGEKSFERNLREASKWPDTYAELSKSGNGIHLHYIYDGDPDKLEKLYSPNVEIKVFNGGASLRRKLTKCNALPIAHISSGLPQKGVKSLMVNIPAIKTDKELRKRIEKCLRKEYPNIPNTKPNIDLINHILDEAYKSGLKYDISDMENALYEFASSSHHQAKNCIKIVTQMKLRSDEPPESIPDTNDEDSDIVIFDCEVFPNLFVICWKMLGENNPVNAMINPSPEVVANFIENYKLVGFNNLKYDNHIIYARSLGISLLGLYKLSVSIIKDRTGYLPRARDISYTDIFDFSSKKQSLKKFEIELTKKGKIVHHQELGLRWDQPVPEDMWDLVVEYCTNDVLATEATFYDRKADFAGRKILAKLANGRVNDTTNSLTAKFIFKGDPHPQSQFNYRFMGDIPDKVYRSKVDAENGVIFNNFGDEYTLFDEQGRPVFPGYKFDKEKKESTYRGEVVGEGGEVYAEPGIYGNVALLDIESMHPHSLIAEKLFGEYYTGRFAEIVKGRLSVKHKDFELARTLLNGELAPYLDDPELVSGLKQALKIAINAVYGMTSASFKNAFKDDRNIDNIVAKRGALFMINLRHEVQRRGFVVAHIKTDSIKIPDATPEIIKFVQDYGEQYGYTFLHEATYERMCLVNDAVYIAKYDTAENAEKKYGYVPVDLIEDGGKWTATGTQFQVPYVFKTLFTHEPIEFFDMCETKSVTSALYLDMNENLPEGEHDYQFIGRVGLFCPIKPGYGGGMLLRENENEKTGEITYASAVGAKNYRWLEAETVMNTGMEDSIDISFYETLVDKAVDAIKEQGDFEWFVSDEPYVPKIEWPYQDNPPWIETVNIFQTAS